MKRLPSSLISLIFCCLCFLTACQPSSNMRMTTIQGETMGTTYTVKYLTDSNTSPAQPTQAELDALLREVNRQMSTYQTDSEISRFNQMKAAQGAMSISNDFATVVAEAIRLNQFTEGALDVTIGPLVNLWGFGPDKRIHKTPTSAELAQTIPNIGIDKIHLTLPQANQAAQLSKATDHVYLDLSAIAKGFGVDKIATYLEQLGIQNYLVEIGGELRAKGKNPQQQIWNVGIEQPQILQKQTSQIVVPLNNQALATSGDYRNFQIDSTGKRLSHIIHPQTQQPISHQLASISVIADNAMTADGLSTGLFVLGEERALALAEQHQLAIFLIIKTEQGFETKMSSAFQKLLH